MAVIIDNQLQEAIAYDPAVYPIAFYQDELATLPGWSGPLHWHPGFEIATAECGTLDYQLGEQHIILNAILSSTLFFAVFGIEYWKIMTALWALIPLFNAVNFISCPIEKLNEDGSSMSISKLLRVPVFWMMIFLMICAGASEATMAQWASAFTESALKVSKTIGDLAGPCLFAAFMGIARMLYGKFSDKLNLVKTMLLCGVAAAICYLVASLASWAIPGLLGCALCGLAVGIMWPGTISLSSRKCPAGGTAMFAFLALAGDLGATVSPAMVGKIAEITGENLKNGLLAATVFPICMALGLFWLYKNTGKKS